jgi:hypothetical protein
MHTYVLCVFTQHNVSTTDFQHVCHTQRGWVSDDRTTAHHLLLALWQVACHRVSHSGLLDVPIVSNGVSPHILSGVWEHTHRSRVTDKGRALLLEII